MNLWAWIWRNAFFVIGNIWLQWCSFWLYGSIHLPGRNCVPWDEMYNFVPWDTIFVQWDTISSQWTKFRPMGQNAPLVPNYYSSLHVTFNPEPWLVQYWILCKNIQSHKSITKSQIGYCFIKWIIHKILLKRMLFCGGGAFHPMGRKLYILNKAEISFEFNLRLMPAHYISYKTCLLI